MNVETPTRSARTERLDIRLTPEVRTTLVRAANLTGTSLSDYVSRACLVAARRDIAEEHQIRLSDEAWDEFTDALDNPNFDALDEILSSRTIWDR